MNLTIKFDDGHTEKHEIASVITTPEGELELIDKDDGIVAIYEDHEWVEFTVEARR